MVNTLVLIQKFQRIYEPTHCDSLPKRGLCTRTTHSPKLWPNGQSFCRPPRFMLGRRAGCDRRLGSSRVCRRSASWELVKSPDRVVVVGAGVVGLSTAWFLQERGVEVTVVDRDGVAADASWGNAGWLAPALTLPLPEPAVLQYGLRAMLSPSSPVYVPLTTDLKLIRFLVGFARHCTPSKWQEAMSVYTEVNRTALGAYDELADGGVKELTRLADPFLAAFASEKDRQTLVDEFHHVEAAGGEVDFDLLDYDAIHSLEPSLGQGVKAGLRLRNQRFIDPPLFVNSLADAVRERGGEIVSGFDVTQIDDRVGGVTVRSAHGDSRDGDSVVISSGARLNKLAAPFGVRKLVQGRTRIQLQCQARAPPQEPCVFPPPSASHALRCTIASEWPE